MYTGFLHLHSFIAYLLLAAFVFALVYSAVLWGKQKPFSETNRKIVLIGFIAAHIQLVIGLVLYFISPNGLSNFSGEHMSDAHARLYMLEHPLVMIMAIVLITMGYLKSKKATTNTNRYKNIVLFYSIGLVLILSRIPWSHWLG